MSEEVAKEEVKETSEERQEREANIIREIEKYEAINFPKINYKWYEIQNKVVIEIYIKELKQDDVKARVDEEDASVLYITVRGDEHKFDLYGPVADPKVAVRKVKAEVTVTSTSVPSHFPVLLKAEGRINEAKQRKYAELDKIGAKDKGHSPNDFFNDLFNGCNTDQRKAMIKSMQESGGTVLSTNWEEVSKARVEPKRGD